MDVVWGSDDNDECKTVSRGVASAPFCRVSEIKLIDYNAIVYRVHEPWREDRVLRAVGGLWPSLQVTARALAGAVNALLN